MEMLLNHNLLKMYKFLKPSAFRDTLYMIVVSEIQIGAERVRK